MARMKAGDWLVYYSPRESLSGNEPVKAFTAIGEVVDDDIWQADEGDFKPWRRAVIYEVSGRPARERPPEHPRADVDAFVGLPAPAGAVAAD
ncbi:MAG: EVE domain-containing protein [Geodermatophilaceae bacterium]